MLTCVATQSLAVLGATVVAHRTHLRGGLVAGAALIVGGVALDGWTLTSFDWAQLRRGAGDHWILAGALSISSLATAQGLRADRTGAALSTFAPVMRALDVILWALAVAVTSLLVFFELRVPHRRYDVQRWATVFPLGMTAAATQAVGRVESLRWVTSLGDVLTSAALLAWTAMSWWSQRRRLARSTHVDGHQT